MPVKITKLRSGKYKVEGMGVVSKESLLEDNICPECLRELPPAILEDRGGGYSELVTYCKCGATYNGGLG